MKIQKRITSVKRHTIGYVISGKRYTRGQAVKLAQRNKIDGVTVRRGPDGLFIAYKPLYGWGNLYNLPVVVERPKAKSLAAARG